MALNQAQINDIKQHLPPGSFVQIPGDSNWYDHLANPATPPGLSAVPGGCIFEWIVTPQPPGTPPIVTGVHGVWNRKSDTCVTPHKCNAPTAMDPLMPSGTLVRCPCE